METGRGRGYNEIPPGNVGEGNPFLHPFHNVGDVKRGGMRRRNKDSNRGRISKRHGLNNFGRDSASLQGNTNEDNPFLHPLDNVGDVKRGDRPRWNKGQTEVRNNETRDPHNFPPPTCPPPFFPNTSQGPQQHYTFHPNTDNHFQRYDHGPRGPQQHMFRPNTGNNFQRYNHHNLHQNTAQGHPQNPMRPNPQHRFQATHPHSQPYPENYDMSHFRFSQNTAPPPIHQISQEPYVNPGYDMQKDPAQQTESNLYRVNSVGSLSSEKNLNLNDQRSKKNNWRKDSKNKYQNNLANNPSSVNLIESCVNTTSRNLFANEPFNNLEYPLFSEGSRGRGSKTPHNFRGRGSRRVRVRGGHPGLVSGIERPPSRSSSVCSSVSNDFEELNLSSESVPTKKTPNNRGKNWRGRGDKRGHKGPRAGGDNRPVSRQSSCSNEDNTNQESDMSCYNIQNEYNQMGRQEDSARGVTNSQGKRKPKEKSKNKAKEKKFPNVQVPTITFEQVEKLRLFDALELVEILSEDKNDYSSLLLDDLEPKVFILVVDILSKICDTPPSQKKAEILRKASLPVFTNQLFNCVVKYPSLEDESMLQNVNQFFENAISLYETLFDFMPSAARMLTNHISELQKSLKKMSNNPKIVLNKNMIHVLIGRANYLLGEVSQNLKEQVVEVKTQSHENKKETYFPEPVGNFRTVSLYPRPEDIYAEQPFLYPNITEGPYGSVEHYLDIHFKLLREDFMSPIRQAMRDYKKQCNTKDRFKRVDNVRIYRRVKFLHPKTVFDTVGYEVCFDVDKKMNRVNWEFSNRFMYGSLLLFSDDNFDSFFLATVANRNVKELENKLVTVELVESLINVKSILGKEFIMAESEAYFNPYYQVLKALQGFDETNFPLAQYIVHANTETQPPRYLNLDVNYSIKMAENSFTFRVLSDMEWPTAHDLGLDPSQYNAFKAALTNDLTVIQGPPGTGKTFLGLKIAHALLKNSQVWNYTNTPIFVVCFTNHALDQFLEGLLPVTTRLVRIGGKSKGGELDKFNIRERRKEYSYYKKVHGREMRDLKLKMSTVFADIQVYQNNLKALENITGVVSLKTLQFVSEVLEGYFPGGDNDFMDWLLEGVAGAKNKGKVKITITADGGVVKAAPTQEQSADADERIKQAFFDTKDLDTSVGPSEDTVTVQFACILGNVAKRRDELLQQINGTNRLHRTQLLNIKNTCESLDSLLCHLKKELLPESKKYPRSELEKNNLLEERNLRQLKPEDRWKLYHTWVNILREGLIVTLDRKDAEYKDLSSRYEQIRQNDDLAILKSAIVVGTTTTLAAKYQSMFVALAPRIVIVEEAAEVLEAHIIASLSQSCEHLILIGDHKQLRPSVAEVRMARQYKLDVSLFERLVLNNMACHTLSLQHRMRPEISRQLVPTIYPELRDDISVLNRADIQGMDKNVFFMTHNNFEDEVTEITSKRNRFEAEILLGLAKYLVQQGYKPKEITILATYKGQMYHMKNEIKNMTGFPKGIQITVVDNFQGEENKIILLSLVRSNAVKKIGFLEIENRICVALSRARDGLYIVGNMNCLTANSEIWVNIRNSLAQMKCFGPTLNLRCQIHREQITKIESAKDFSKVSEGGCSLLCSQMLPCGHFCKSMCHVEQDYHLRYKCKEPCNMTLCGEMHQCPKKCHQPCGLCEIPMRRQLPCNHYVNLPCHQDIREYQCLEPVEVVVPLCHHRVSVPCHTKLEPVCTMPCPRRLECGHSCEKTCHEGDDADHLDYGCMKPCARLKQGCSQNHKCELLCFDECTPCIEMVVRELLCGHSLKLACNADLTNVVCMQKCKRVLDCGHPCTKKCFQECGPCDKPVMKKIIGCGHEMEIPCGMPAERQRCEGRCPSILACGHQCSQRCKDICSRDACQEPVEVKEKIFSLFGKQLFNLKSIFPLKCGHREALLPCNIANRVDKMMPEELLQYCSEPCNQQLMCEHKCGGTCGQCMQGRIHKLCNEQCGNVLICGHSCKVPCREVCPPCQEPCRHECKHSRCSRKCGEECVPCKERCDYVCPHQTCSRRCGDLCNRDPCYEPCPQRLHCGHSCVGFCGEPCPPCRKCEPKHFEEFFCMGEETEEDSKWVLLVDCQHTFETTGLEMWLQMEQEGGEIGCKVCPRCKTPIVKVQRYMNLIKQTYHDIQRIKAKVFGKRDDIVKERAEALKKIKAIEFKKMPIMDDDTATDQEDELQKIFEELNGELPEVKGKKRNMIDTQRLRVLCFWTEFFITLYKRKCEVWPQLDKENRLKLDSYINSLTRNLMKRHKKISEEEMVSFEREVKRILRIADYLSLKSCYSVWVELSSKTRQLLSAVEKILYSIAVFDENHDYSSKRYLLELKEITRSATVITDTERAMIHQAMSSSFRSSQKTGHWFKCKNGHLYCITECGGAMEEAQCPVRGCCEVIGGSQHRLRDGQTLASEMDGARFAAWSEQNNLANFGGF